MMSVVVDTTIWSLALRRHIPELNAALVNALQSLIASR
jgi:hypothetical protein